MGSQKFFLCTCFLVATLAASNSSANTLRCEQLFKVRSESGIAVNPQIDSLAAAILRLNNRDFFPHNLLESMLRTEDRPQIEAQIVKGLNAGSVAEATIFANYVAYKNKVYPSSYYFTATHQGWGLKPNAPSPEKAGRQMPYLEFTGSNWIEHKDGGSATLLRSLVAERKPLVLYRGSNVVEGAIWEKLKQMRATGSAQLTKNELVELNDLIGKPRKIGRVKVGVPAKFGEGWKKIRTKLLGKSHATVVSAVMRIWSAGYPAIFTSPDYSAAVHFAGREPGVGGVIAYTIDPNKLIEVGSQGTYVGIENNYIELAFSSRAGRELLLDSFEGFAQESLRAK